MAAKKLSDAEIQENLGQLNGWTVEEGKLHKEFNLIPSLQPSVLWHSSLWLPNR